MNETAYLSIRQFAKFTGVSQATLRHYDHIGLLPAASRGEDNHYRLYRPGQRTALNFINVLADLGVDLSDIKDIIAERTPERLIRLLSQQEIDLDDRLNRLRTAYSIIHTLRRNIQAGLNCGAEDIRVEVLEDIRFILGPVNQYGDENDILRDPYVRFCDAAKEYRINLRYPVGGYYYDMETFQSDPVRPSKYFSMDPLGNCVREPGEYLVGYQRGARGDWGELPGRMTAYAEERGLMLSGPVYVVPLLDEISMSDPEQYMRRVSVHVAGRGDRSARQWQEDAERCPFKPTCVRPHCAV